MWTQTPAGEEVIQELSKQLVSQFAPEELEIFDELYGDYQKHPNEPASERGMDDPLGSGLGEILVVITPAATAMATAVVSFILNEVLKAAEGEASETIKARVRALFNPKTSEKTPPLSTEQLEKVQKLAVKRAVDFGLSADQAKQMALALVGSLSIK